MKSADEEAATHPDIVSIDPFASLSLVRLDRSEPGWLHRVCLLHEFHSSRQLQKPPGLPVCSLPPWPSPPGGGRERCSLAPRASHGRCPRPARRQAMSAECVAQGRIPWPKGEASFVLSWEPALHLDENGVLLFMTGGVSYSVNRNEEALLFGKFFF